MDNSINTKSQFFVEKETQMTGKESVQLFFHNKKYEFEDVYAKEAKENTQNVKESWY